MDSLLTLALSLWRVEPLGVITRTWTRDLADERRTRDKGCGEIGELKLEVKGGLSVGATNAWRPLFDGRGTIV